MCASMSSFLERRRDVAVVLGHRSRDDSPTTRCWPSLLRILRWWSTKSSSMSNDPRPVPGTVPVVSPRGLT